MAVQPSPVVSPSLVFADQAAGLMPVYDLNYLSHYLPNEQQITIEVNGVVVGEARIVAEASREFAIGWALINGYIDPLSRIAHITSTQTHISIMTQGGLDEDRIVVEHVPAITSRSFITQIDAISMIERAFKAFEADDSRAGYLHVALLDAEDVLCVVRDISGEGALAKLLGWVFSEDVEVSRTMLVVCGIVTDRVVEAAANLGIPVIATDAVPTSKAITLAEHYGLTMIGMALSHRRGILTHGGHLRS